MIFKENPAVGLPEVYKLIDSAISKRQGDQKKHSFLEKKTLWKGKGIHYKHPEISHHLMDRAMKQQTYQFHKIFFSYLKMFTIQCRKNIRVEDNKEMMNMDNFINIYTNIYISILYETRMTQN